MPDLTDTMARHAHYVERYKTGQVNQINPFIANIEDDLIRLLGRQNTFRSQQRIENVLDAIYSSTFDNMDEYMDIMEENLGEFGISESEFLTSSLSLEQGFEYDVPAPRQIRAAAYSKPFDNKLLKDTLNDFSPFQAQQIRNSAALGFAEGQTNQQIMQRIIGTPEFKGKDGMLNLTRNSASRIVRTSTNHMASAAQQATYQENGIGMYKWSSILDSRTSSICQKLDGEVFHTGKGATPPAHQNCRSTTVPVFPDETYVDSEGVLRAKVDGMRPQIGASGRGRTSANLSYNDWLKKQPNYFQNDVLGKSKGALFRKGGLSVSKFVENGQPLTLAELKAKYPKVWDKSGLK